MKTAAITIDAESRRVLRALGTAALALSDGHPIDDHQLRRHMTTAAVADDAGTTLLTVPEVCAQLRISRWSFYRLIQHNQLRSVMIGRRRLVPQSEINQFITTLGERGALT